MINNNTSLHNLSQHMTFLPQVLINFYFKHQRLPDNHKIISVLNDSKKVLGENDRILLRQSGTEPCIRIMIEGKNYMQIHILAKGVVDVIRRI